MTRLESTKLPEPSSSVEPFLSGAHGAQTQEGPRPREPEGQQEIDPGSLGEEAA